MSNQISFLVFMALQQHQSSSKTPIYIRQGLIKVLPRNTNGFTENEIQMQHENNVDTTMSYRLGLG